jgi:hypothetical protein
MNVWPFSEKYLILVPKKNTKEITVAMFLRTKSYNHKLQANVLNIFFSKI